MKHVKELSIIQGAKDNSNSMEDLEWKDYAIGFASTDFIIWNLMNESKILQVPCGGWRRPYSYYLGDIPQIQNCFAFLKDHKIHIHRLWEPGFERQLFPKILHMQCHGREIHSSCLISFRVNPQCSQYKDLWVATGSEDGTVRLTRYTPFNVESWSTSQLLGEHVGGSAVRSLCFISKMYTYGASQRYMPDGISACNSLLDKENYQFLLISVGAKQVLTSWLLRERTKGNEDESCIVGSPRGTTPDPSIEESSSISFQWLSTHLPPKLPRTCRTLESRSMTQKGKNTLKLQSAHTLTSHLTETLSEQTKSMVIGENDNDWRYLAVTAFLVEGADFKSKVCFVVVACSDATLTLRALLLPHRLWFDVALLHPQTSPVLALQHVVVPMCEHSKCSILILKPVVCQTLKFRICFLESLV
uniref:WD repeat-containing protein 6 n=1 Tax=Anthurium amnicola TaxID=1678845 RepID=A0A1D1ZB85_9ARAE